jgi:hypothetical protein
MSLVRLLKTAQVTLTHEFRVDETLTDAAGAVTAVVKRLDGTTVAGSPFTAAHPGLGTYTFALPGQANLDSLTVDWTGSIGGAAVTVRDYVEVCGGFLFGLAEARAAHSGLSSTATYPSSMLAAKRIEVEQECEAICRQAFVPRFARETLSGLGTARLGTPRSMLRTVRAVTVDGVAWAAPDVAAVGVSDHGVLTRPAGALWPAGFGNIVVELEHGWDFPPEEIRQAGMLRLRSRLAQTRSGVPDRALSFSAADGGTYRLSTPSRQRTGIPDVDGPYERYTRAQRSVFA